MIELFIVGLVSGIVTRYAGEHRWLEGLEVFEVRLFVGIVYAAIVGGWLVVRGPGRTPAVLAWAALVVVAWVAAVRVAVATVGALDPADFVPSSQGGLILAGVVGGAVGGAIVALASTLLLPATRSRRAFAIVAGVGAVAGLSILVDADDFWPLVVVWQSAVAGATGYVAEEE